MDHTRFVTMLLLVLSVFTDGSTLNNRGTNLFVCPFWTSYWSLLCNIPLFNLSFPIVEYDPYSTPSSKNLFYQYFRSSSYIVKSFMNFLTLGFTLCSRFQNCALTWLVPTPRRSSGNTNFVCCSPSLFLYVSPLIVFSSDILEVRLILPFGDLQNLT